jgi:AmmeMemoRadiSam system protein B
MNIRPPAVAGSFYEAVPSRLRVQVEDCFIAVAEPAVHTRFIAGVVPHAGLIYSGSVAAAFYAAAELPRRFVILCPNHTGFGHPAAINRDGAWRTPLGDARIDTPLADALLAKTRLLQVDTRAHAREHSLEVQLPFLQLLLDDAFTFVPICLATHQYELCEEVGNAVADAIAESAQPIGILASSDFNHYEDQQTTLRKDQLAIDAILALDPEQLWHNVREADISMCGFLPTIATIVAAKRLGATRAELLRHATSGDVNGDYGHVVGYASLLLS